MLLRILALAFALLLPGTAIADTQNSVGTVVVSGTVIGIKPVVQTFTPTSGVTNAATPITQIVGKNFTGATVVTLSDQYSTVLTGTSTVETQCQSDGTNCGNVGAHGQTYDRITGLTIPSGLTTGNYYLMVTTSNGTNTTSDITFGVTAPTAGASATIVSVDPDPLIADASGTATVTLSVNDSDSASIAYAVDQSGGTFSAATGSIALSSQSGSATLTFTAGSTPGYFTNEWRVDDDGNANDGNDDALTTGFFVQPPF